jgi:hypothetical protein
MGVMYAITNRQEQNQQTMLSRINHRITNIWQSEKKIELLFPKSFEEALLFLC